MIDQMRFIISVILCCNRIFPAPSWAGKNMSSFSKSEKKIITDFRQFVLRGEFDKANDLIDKANTLIAQDRAFSEFKISDLYSAYSRNGFDGKMKSSFDSQISEKIKNLLTDFCVNSPALDDQAMKFYEKMIRTVKVDDLINHQTPLAIISKSDPVKNNWKCAEILLKYGANPLYELDKYSEDKGTTYSPLDLAIINNNKSLINIFLFHIKKMGLFIPPRTQELINAYKGGNFESRWIWGKHINELFRVANQSLNFKLVRRMLHNHKYLRKREREYIAIWQKSTKNKQNNFYYQPLWSFNILMLRKYARKIIAQLKLHVIEDAKLTELPGRRIPGVEKLYSYDSKGGQIILLKKNILPLVGRVLGADHFANCPYLPADVKVAKKYVVAPKRGLRNSKIVFSLPHEYFWKHKSQNRNFINYKFKEDNGLNPVNVEIESLELYVQYIEGQEQPIRSAPQICGFIDNVPKNSIWKNNTLYVIDTGDDKNFIVPIPDSQKALKIKSMHFAPYISKITIDLSKEDL